MICWDQLLRFCWNQLLRWSLGTDCKIICWDKLLRISVEFICWDQLSRFYVQLLLYIYIYIYIYIAGWLRLTRQHSFARPHARTKRSQFPGSTHTRPYAYFWTWPNVVFYATHWQWRRTVQSLCPWISLKGSYVSRHCSRPCCRIVVASSSFSRSLCVFEFTMPSIIVLALRLHRVIIVLGRSLAAAAAAAAVDCFGRNLGGLISTKSMLQNGCSRGNMSRTMYRMAKLRWKRRVPKDRHCL